MTINQKPTGMAVSIPTGLGYGILTACSVTLLGALAAAGMISNGILHWNHAGYAVMVILILSSWAGAIMSSCKIKHRCLMMCLISGILYFLILMMATALFFGGRYSGVGETILLIFCGSMLGVLTVCPGKTGKTRRKIKRVNR